MKGRSGGGKIFTAALPFAAAQPGQSWKRLVMLADRLKLVSDKRGRRCGAACASGTCRWDYGWEKKVYEQHLKSTEVGKLWECFAVV